MLTDGEATATYEAGGAGGKFRKRPFRRSQPTPYDRPPTALRNPSWLSKLVVDPASKLINAGAQRFLASLFRKRLPPPPLHSPPTPEKRQESSDVLHDSGPNNHSGVLQPTVHESSGAAYYSDSNAFSELEQLLKQKTFTRSEIDRLTKLLHSKVVDSSIGECDRRVEADYSTPAPVLSGGLLEENKTERLTSRGVITTPVISSKIHENDVASPADLAKSYMGSRPSKVSPSMLSSRSQAVRQDASLLKMVPYDSKSPIISLANRPIGLVGVPENGFNTSRSRGRSAIYSMARTPYSRVRTTNVEAGGSKNYVFGRPSSSQSMLEHDESFGSKQVSGKRRSSVLDDDLGSVGPIRRIRQKPNLLSHEVSGAAKHPLHLSQEVSNFVEENQDNRIPSTSRAHVPNKSCETAAKILEHLDKLTPKKKSSESKLAALKEKFPSKLAGMVDGQGIRIHEYSDSSKLLQNARDSYKSEDHSNAATPDFHNSGLPKLDSVRENGPKKLVDMANPLSNNELLHQKFVAPENKHAYKTSSYEDAFQLHHDVQSIGSAPKPVTEVITKAEISLVGNTQFISKELSGDKASASPEFRTPPGFLSKRTDEVTPDGVIKGVKNSCSPTSVDAHRSPEVTQSTSASDKLEQTYSNKVLSTAFSLPSVTETKGSTSIFWNGSKPESSSSLANLAPDPTDALSKLSESHNSRKADSIDVPLVASITTSATLFSSKSAPSNTSSLSNGQFSPSNAFSSTSVLASSNCENHGFTSSPSEAAPSTTSVMATNIAASTSTSCGGGSIFAGASLAAARSECSTFAVNSSAPSLSTGALFQSSVFNTAGSVDNAKPSLPGFGSVTGLQIMTTQFGSSMSSPVSGTSGFTSFGSTSSTTTPFASGAMFGPTSTASSESNLTGSSSTMISNVFSFGSSSSAAAPFTFSFGASSTASSPETKTLASFSGATPGVFNFGGSSVASSSSSATAAIFNFGGSSVASSSSSVTTTGFGFNGTASPSPVSATPGGTSASSSVSLVSPGSNATPGTFTFGASSSTSSQSTPMTSSSGGAGIFGSGWQSPAFGSSPSPTGFTFGASSSSFSTSSTAPMAFGSSLGASSSPAFTFGAVSSTSASQSMLGSSTATFDATPGNNDQMTMEDNMAEDPVQSSAPAVSVFGQASFSPPSPVTFGSTVPLSNPFQFGGQQNPATPQNSSPFQATTTPPNPFQFGGQQNPAAPPSPSPFQPPGTLGFSTGGSFSLGSAGNDKSGRRIVKINRNKNRRK